MTKWRNNSGMPSSGGITPLRKVWRYQRGNQKLQIEGQIIQWQKEKEQNNDLLNITQKTKDQVTRTPLKPGGGEMSSGRVRYPWYEFKRKKQKTEDQATRTPLKPGGGEMYLHQLRKYKNPVIFCKSEKFVCCMYFFVEIDDCRVDNNDRKYYWSKKNVKLQFSN